MAICKARTCPPGPVRPHGQTSKSSAELAQLGGSAEATREDRHCPHSPDRLRSNRLRPRFAVSFGTPFEVAGRGALKHSTRACTQTSDWKLMCSTCREYHKAEDCPRQLARKKERATKQGGK